MIGIITLILNHDPAYCFDLYNWKSYNLKGKVKEKSVNKYRIKYKFGKPEKALSLTTVYKFNNAGNLTEMEESSGNRSVKSRIDFKYDNSERLIEVTGYKKKKTFDYRLLYFYDDPKNQVRNEHYYSDGSLSSKGLFKYDNNKQEIERQYYSSDGSLRNKVLFTYNDRGGLINHSAYNSENKKIGEEDYEYDDKGNIIQIKTYRNGSIAKKTVNEFNKKGQAILSKHYNTKDSLVRKNTYKYDENGNVIENEEYEYSHKFGKYQSELKSVVEYTYKYYSD